MLVALTRSSGPAIAPQGMDVVSAPRITDGGSGFEPVANAKLQGANAKTLGSSTQQLSCAAYSFTGRALVRLKKSINQYTVIKEAGLSGSWDEAVASLLQESSSSSQARISVSLPRGIHKQLKLLALDRDVTISTLLLGLIKAEIQRAEAINS